jgi:hypothetical protein
LNLFDEYEKKSFKVPSTEPITLALKASSKPGHLIRAIDIDQLYSAYLTTDLIVIF